MIQTIEGIAADSRWRSLIQSYRHWDARCSVFTTLRDSCFWPSLFWIKMPIQPNRNKQVLAGNICLLLRNLSTASNCHYRSKRLITGLVFVIANIVHGPDTFGVDFVRYGFPFTFYCQGGFMGVSMPMIPGLAGDALVVIGSSVILGELWHLSSSKRKRVNMAAHQ
jgi:hypothetical protein